IRERHERLDEIHSRGVDTICRNNVSGKKRASSGIKWTYNLARSAIAEIGIAARIQVRTFLLCQECGDGLGGASPLARLLKITKDEGLVFLHGSANRPPKLIQSVVPDGQSFRVEVAVGIQLVVSEELEKVSMPVIGA